MRTIPTVLEVAISLILISLGVFLLYGAFFDKAGSVGGFVLACGAVFLTLGFFALGLTIRNFLWHRQMLHQSAKLQSPRKSN